MIAFSQSGQQLHQGIVGNTVLMNYAVWESPAHFRGTFIIQSSSSGVELLVRL
jgi:hypothetical protein